MSGETDLKALIATMKPALDDKEYVFCSVKKFDSVHFDNINPIGTFAEKEGITVIVEKKSADANGLKYESVFALITLTVHSSLDAVGLTAAVSSALAKAGISANVVAAYFHDHIFVQAEKAQLALTTLNNLSKW